MKLNKSKGIRIGHKVFEVHYHTRSEINIVVDGEDNGSYIMGAVMHAEDSTIHIHQGQEPGRLRETLRHESLHAITRLHNQGVWDVLPIVNDEVYTRLTCPMIDDIIRAAADIDKEVKLYATENNIS